MRHIALIAIASATLLASTPALAREHLTGEQQLAKLLQGRVAGKPVDCINLVTAQNSMVIDKTAIVYDSGSVMYVNRPRDASSLNSDDILITKTWGSELCRMDVVKLRDRGNFMFTGFVSLEDFVPYTRAPKPVAVSAPAPGPAVMQTASAPGN
jgi:hypothetical protein